MKQSQQCLHSPELNQKSVTELKPFQLVGAICMARLSSQNRTWPSTDLGLHAVQVCAVLQTGVKHNLYWYALRNGFNRIMFEPDSCASSCHVASAHLTYPTACSVMSLSKFRCYHVLQPSSAQSIMDCPSGSRPNTSSVQVATSSVNPTEADGPGNPPGAQGLPHGRPGVGAQMKSLMSISLPMPKSSSMPTKASNFTQVFLLICFNCCYAHFCF